MASLLRQIVAGPRARHPEAGLDLCYVTDNIIATSGPSGTYPQLAYRNPLSQLVKFLDYKHGDQWAIWEFRAEGTGYPDAEVYNRINHYPWPDHHPPPFALIPLIMGSMRNWLKGYDPDIKDSTLDTEHGKKGQHIGRVVVVHCKAGKGRSGTVACSYLISEEGWKAEEALKRFTERRMRPGFGAGVSIPSQLRWVSYVDRWAQHGKKYVERPVEVLEVHVWGLRDGVKVAVQGFKEEGRKIHNFHTFAKSEREIVREGIKKNSGVVDTVTEAARNEKNANGNLTGTSAVNNGPRESSTIKKAMNDAQREPRSTDTLAANSGDIVFRPAQKLVLETNDINIDFERRNKATAGFSMVTSVAHVWFNVFFEGRGPEQHGSPDSSGVFEIEWDAMDGLKGSSRKGTRAFDRLAVLWRSVPDTKQTRPVPEPGEGDVVSGKEPADWTGEEATPSLGRNLGLRPSDPSSATVSRASSPGPKEEVKLDPVEDDSDTEGTRRHVDESEVRAVEQARRPVGPLPVSSTLPGETHRRE
ncbi:hypothetical protein MBLNU457_4883t1 [Dothideomycetes sp. NU457]